MLLQYIHIMADDGVNFCEFYAGLPLEWSGNRVNRYVQTVVDSLFDTDEEIYYDWYFTSKQIWEDNNGYKYSDTIISEDLPF